MKTNASKPVKIRRSGAICAAFLLVYSGLVAAQGATTSDAASQYRAEITSILDNRDVQAAMQHIVAIEPQSRRDLIELTEIPAPPFGEEKRAQRFAEMLREAGLSDVTIDEVGNAIGRRPGKSGDRVIAYSAHLDTVFPIETDVTVKFDDEKMYAPGIGDNTRGLVTVLGVLRALQETGITTDADILFIGNVGEEGLGDLRGVKHLFRDGAPRIDTLIAVDGGESESAHTATA
jgi:acetylornithine deacetylase/succinyl-diaminopimelate desuccinylase-like protein